MRRHSLNKILDHLDSRGSIVLSEDSSTQFDLHFLELEEFLENLTEKGFLKKEKQSSNWIYDKIIEGKLSKVINLDRDATVVKEWQTEFHKSMSKNSKNSMYAAIGACVAAFISLLTPFMLKQNSNIEGEIELKLNIEVEKDTTYQIDTMFIISNDKTNNKKSGF